MPRLAAGLLAHTLARPALALPALALTLLVAGCGGGAGTGTSAGPAAPDPNAPLPRYATVGEIASATSAQQKADKTAKIVITGGLSGQTQGTMSGDGALRYDEAGPSLQLTQRMAVGSGTPLELGLVVLPDAAFVHPPENGGLPLPPGKTWIRVAPDSTNPMSRQFGQLIRAMRDNSDPVKSFAQFGDAMSIVESSEDPVDGVRAVRYKLRVDLAKAAERQPDPAIKQSLQQSVQSGLASLDYTMWLDQASRPIRVLVDQAMPQNQGTFTLDVRYRDWGQPVQIAAPPAEQVADR